MSTCRNTLHNAAVDLAKANMELLASIGYAPGITPSAPADAPAVQPLPDPMPEPETRQAPRQAPELAPVRLQPPMGLPNERHAAYAGVVALAQLRENVLLIGPTGCGKTILGAQVAETLQLPYGSQSCSAGMSEGQLAGWLLPIGAAGSFEYVPSVFVSLYEHGGVFLLDELDAADENTLLLLNGALAGNSWHLPQRFKAPEIRRHPDFVCIAAANSVGGGDDVYTGRNRLDGATLDRFRAGIVSMDYDAALERKVVLPQVLDWATKLRSWMREQGMARPLSTRVLVRFSMQAKQGAGRKAWEQSYFADWSDSEISRWRAANVQG